jgi:hypothetical protein
MHHNVNYQMWWACTQIRLMHLANAFPYLNFRVANLHRANHKRRYSTHLMPWRWSCFLWFQDDRHNHLRGFHWLKTPIQCDCALEIRTATSAEWQLPAFCRSHLRPVNCWCCCCLVVVTCTTISSKLAHRRVQICLENKLDHITDPIPLSSSQVYLLVLTAYRTGTAQNLTRIIHFESGTLSSSSCATAASSSDSRGWCKAFRSPNTMKRFVSVNKDSAPPCSQSTLGRDVP